MTKQDVEEFGWVAVPRNRSNVPSEDSCATASIPIDSGAIWPSTDVVKKAREWVKARLPEETFNHSLRVYSYGTQTFPTASTTQSPQMSDGILQATPW